MVEPGVAIIASSLATIRPLLRALKIRGFESTQRTPSTGMSSKRNPGSMPGYGPNDVSLHRVTVIDSESRAPGIPFDEYHRHAAGLSSHNPLPSLTEQPLGNNVDIRGGTSTPVRSDSKSEIFIIEGKRESREYPASDRSLENIHALEEQSQEYGHGLSVGRTRPL